MGQRDHRNVLLVSSSGDDPQDHQDRQDFIRESAELFESDDDKKSKKRLADFSKSVLLQRLMQIEKEEQVQKSQRARPGSAKSLMRQFEEDTQDSVPRDVLQQMFCSFLYRATYIKRSFRAVMSPQQSKPSRNDASESDSGRESTATDSTRSTTRKRPMGFGVPLLAHRVHTG